MAKRNPDDGEVAIESKNHKNGSYDEDLDNANDDDDEEEEEDDEQQHRRKKDKKKKKKKKRVRIMHASGQTDADRRILRRRLRELHTEISFDGPVAAAAAVRRGGTDDSSCDEDDERMEERTTKSSSSSSGLQSWREKNNALWNDVRFTREAVLDSENMDLISSKAAREVEKIIQVPRYDAVTLAQNLVKKGSIRNGGTHQFHWAGLGFQVGVCFSSLPSNCSFLYGPLDADFTPKERKKVERKKKLQQMEEEMENLEEEKPENMDQKKKVGDGNELSAVEKHIKTINQTLVRRTNEEKALAKERLAQYMTQLTQEEGIRDERELAKKKKKFMKEAFGKVDAVNCLFNPKSFTQTVENIFHFSFAVKAGTAEIKTRGAEEAEEYGLEPGPVVMGRDLNNEDTATAEKATVSLPTQAIVALSMKDWRDMCAAYSVEESDVPHRGGETPAKKRARKSD